DPGGRQTDDLQSRREVARGAAKGREGHRGGAVDAEAARRREGERVRAGGQVDEMKAAVGGRRGPVLARGELRPERAIPLRLAREERLERGRRRGDGHGDAGEPS